MNEKVLVTGAPGNIGTEVVYALRALKADYRIAAFDTELAKKVFGGAEDIVQFDFLKPETYQQTFEGIDRMFLVRPPQLANVKRDIAPALHAAAEAGVKQIVFLSIQGVENNKIVPHYKIEVAIKALGMAYTFLRCGFFMQNLSTTHRDEIKNENIIYIPVGEAKTSFIDARDIAAVAAKVLTEKGHGNQTYTLTGSEALNYYEVAEIMSEVLERKIAYKNPSALGFFFQQIKKGTKLGYAVVVTLLYTITKRGNAEDTSDDVETILQRKPILFEQFVQDNKEIWNNSASPIG
ncbi:SDR family oxidoreductase [Anaerolineales bacterium]